MFQTELNLALQSFASDGLTFVMRMITWTGYEQFTISLLVVIMAGIDFRRGFLLFQIIVWTGFLNELTKYFFGLPRPSWVDSRVFDLESGALNTTPFTSMGGKAFFQLPPADVIEALRGAGKAYGFPSGHVAGAVSLWGGLSILYRKQFLYWILGAMVILMPLSRMYLGRHFLADVLGGMVLGGIVLLAAYILYDRYRWRELLFEIWNIRRPLALRNGVLIIVLFILPFLALFVSTSAASVAGYVLGLNSAFYLLMRKGIPDDTAPLWKRAARVAVTGTLFVGAVFAAWWLVAATGLAYYHSAAEFFVSAGPSVLAFRGGIEISRSLGWYRR